MHKSSLDYADPEYGADIHRIFGNERSLSFAGSGSDPQFPDL